jgi:transposase
MLPQWPLWGGDKRGRGVGKIKRGQGTKLMARAARTGLPRASHVARASPEASTLVAPTRAAWAGNARPARLSGDQASDRTPLEARRADEWRALMAPQRPTRAAPKTQDGRPRRRDQRRWQVSRRFAWRQNCRRVLVRHDNEATNA